MHSLLERQIRRFLGDGAIAGSLGPLLDAVDEAYRGFDADREMADRSIEISSRELGERNRELAERNGQIEAAHGALQTMHEDLKRLAEQLETRVAARTAELRSTNERLVADIAERKKAEEALRCAEEKYRTMFESATDGICQTSPQGTYLSCNPALARIYGYDSPAELQSTMVNLGRQLYVEDGARGRFVKLMAEKGQVSGFEARIYRKDGAIIWISEAARAVRDDDGKLLYYECFVSDITARKRAEEALRESEERYALAVQGASVGLWDWNLGTGQVYYSARWKEMLGCREEEITSLPEEWIKRVHPDDVVAVQECIAAHRNGVTPFFEIEHRMLHADGRYRWMLSRGIATRDESGRASRMAGSQTDVTARKEAEEQLLRDALHDGLTGLPNRVLFTDRLERSLARRVRDAKHLFAVLFIDLDRFKGINDSLGHVLGDQLLIDFARRVGACLRPGDTLARLGGDEFTVLLEDPRDPDNATVVADRILATLKTPFKLGTHEVYIGASIGIAPSTGNYARPEDVLRDSDTAMYRAKALGKSRYQMFDATMHTGAVKLLQMENDLRRAIDRNEFELVYQPIHLIGCRRIGGFEALIRWRHPEQGVISPAEFIPVAEDTGLIVPIGRWVLLEACRQTAEWHAMFPDYPVSVNVNLSGKQFAQSDLVEQVMTSLLQTKLAPQYLTLEITESVVMINPDVAITMLRRLKELGVKLNIDDFGTGYSSLSYLQQFPVDTMKIDRSFVSRMTESPENMEIVRTIIELAHNLKMNVTAEGIETADQLARLTGLHCENGQGYLFSRPVSPVAAAELLNEIRRQQSAA